MESYRFFVRNVISKKGCNADYIHLSQGVGEEAKQTPFIAYSNEEEQAKELENVTNIERWGGKESKGYFLALKTFMIMGFDNTLTFNVDDAGTIVNVK